MPLSYLFTSAREDANTAALIERLHTSEKIRKMSQAKVVTPRAELAGEVLIGETCVYFVPDNPDMPLHTDVSNPFVFHNYNFTVNRQDFLTIVNYR